MADALKLAIIGLDTSHVEAFTRLLHDRSDPWHVEGARIVAAFPGGSADFARSRDRVAGYTAKLRDEFAVHITGSPREAASLADGILLESVDGRVHRELFAEIAPCGKPVFVDKPFALGSGDAAAMCSMAANYGTPLMSCSALRYAAALREALDGGTGGRILGADFYGPMSLEPTQPGYFWYGIHAVEMLVATLGPAIRGVRVTSNDEHDLIVAEWEDGRIGTVRGNRCGNNNFGGLIHREKGVDAIDVSSHPKPYYASLLEKIVEFVRHRRSPVPLEETLAVTGLLERANALREARSVTGSS
jgi:predicted dehydrogenase